MVLTRWRVIDKYGADALRLTLVTGNAPGNDMRFYMGACRSQPKLCEQSMECFPFHYDEYGESRDIRMRLI